MKKTYAQHLKRLILSTLLPCIYGCGPGSGGISALTGFLFGSSALGVGSGSSSLPLGVSSAAAALAGSGTEMAVITNPEPASILLIGSGMMAMTYFQSRQRRKK